MMDDSEAINALVLAPLRAPLRGSLRMPGDKSIAHRALIMAALAQGESSIFGLPAGDDVAATVCALRALGAGIRLEAQEDGSLDARVQGWGEAGPRCPQEPLDCGNAGTAARLLMGALAPFEGEFTFTGDASLRARPMGRVVRPLSAMGARFECCGANGGATEWHLPLRMTGSSRLQGIDWWMEVPSAQVKSAILLAALGALGKTRVIEELPTRVHTEDMLAAFGVPLSRNQGALTLEGPVHLSACSLRVPGDPSSAAFSAVLATLVPGSEILIEGICSDRERTGFVRVLQQMGADLVLDEDAVCAGGIVSDLACDSAVCKNLASGADLVLEEDAACADGIASDRALEPAACKNLASGADLVSAVGPTAALHVRSASHLHACEVPAFSIPSLIDEVPVLALAAAHAEGTSCFHGVSELRVKESDRLQAIVDGLSRLGVKAWVQACADGEDLLVEGAPELLRSRQLQGGDVVSPALIFDAQGDHRMALTWALCILGGCAGGSTSLVGFDSATISYPCFLEDIERLTR